MGSPRWFALCLASATALASSMYMSVAGVWVGAGVAGALGLYLGYEAYREDTQ